MSSKSSTKPSKKGSIHHTAATRDTAASNAHVSPSDLKNMWKTVRAEDQLGGSKTILAIVPPQEVTAAGAEIKKKTREKHGALSSQVRVIAPDELQHTIAKLTRALEKSSGHPKASLSILVSYNISRIGFNVPKVFRSFNMDIFQGSPSSYRLCISVESLYCNAHTCVWNDQSTKLLDKQKFSQSARCYYDATENLPLVKRLISPVEMEPEYSAEDMEEIKHNFEDLFKTVGTSNNSASNPAPQVSTRAAPSPPAATDGSDSWFQKWKGVIATVIGLGVGVAGAMATVKITAAGLYISGPWGLSIAAGFVHGSIIAGAAAAGAGVGLGAAAMVYFVPWDVFFAYLHKKLYKIWDYVCQIVEWAVEKMKELASTFVDCVKVTFGGLAGQRAGPFMR